MDLQYLEKLEPTQKDYEEHKHVLTIDNIRAIASLQQTWKEKEDIDMSKDEIPTKIVKLIINTLGFDEITPGEQQLGYCTRNKLRKFDTHLGLVVGR